MTSSFSSASAAAGQVSPRTLTARATGSIGLCTLAAVARPGSALLPIGSEHNAVHQCLPMQSGPGGGARDEAGSAAPANPNAANAVSGAAFFEGRMIFPGTACLIEETLASTQTRAADSLDVVLCEDAEARRTAEASLQQRSF